MSGGRIYGLDPPPQVPQNWVFGTPRVPLDPRAIPSPPPRALFCCLRGAPYCDDCPSNPANREVP